MPDQFDLDQGVPQGSCLGPVEFTEYSSPVFYVTNQHGKLGHAYADDHQVYCSFHPDSMDGGYESTERCISDISSWMQSMKLNDSKTEYILIGTPQQLAKCSNTYINIRGNVVHASDCVRNLGAYFDCFCLYFGDASIRCLPMHHDIYLMPNFFVF